MKVILSPNPFRDKGLKVALAAREILQSSGVETILCLPFHMEEGQEAQLPCELELNNMTDVLQGADVLICFGGDGTILHTAKFAYPLGIPILGVNLGKMGFMAELEDSDLSLLAGLASGSYKLERRMMLDVKVKRGGRTLFHETALNDAVITKGPVARVVDLTVSADGVTLTSFAGDGVIVSTPTGSTAYSMSAGGPIVEPTADNLIVTPICAHTLQAKSMVLGRDRLMSVSLSGQNRKNAYLSVDGGRAFRLNYGDTVDIIRSRHRTKLVRLTDRSFYEIVNQKLGKA